MEVAATAIETVGVLAEDMSIGRSDPRIIPANQIYTDSAILIGLSSYPATRGHTLVLSQKRTPLFSLPLDDFLDVLDSASQVATALCKHYKVSRCALATDGGTSISLLPLHSPPSTTKVAAADAADAALQSTYPGYITSRSGPQASDPTLDEVAYRVRSTTGLKQPHDTSFDPSHNKPSTQTNLFACLIRGDDDKQHPQWRRVWEDASHVAFLDPYPTTPGQTVLVPRAHLPSNIFAAQPPPAHFTALMSAAHHVANALMRSYAPGVKRCGMVIDGSDIDYAHVKLYPVHEDKTAAAAFAEEKAGVGEFHEVYGGYVTSLDGPRVAAAGKEGIEIGRAARELRRTYRPVGRAKQRQGLATAEAVVDGTSEGCCALLCCCFAG